MESLIELVPGGLPGARILAESEELGVEGMDDELEPKLESDKTGDEIAGEGGAVYSIYTIGHSNHPIDTFLELLERYEIEVLVDVRTNPFSRFSRQFSHDALKVAIQNAGLKYLHLGKELGGKPKEAEFYDAEGHIDYARIAQSERFAEGIKRLFAGCRKYRVAVMCAEENPTDCHRRRLIGPVLFKQGIEEKHIRGNGELHLEKELIQDEKSLSDDSQQLMLFPQPEPQKPWRSSRPAKGKQ